MNIKKNLLKLCLFSFLLAGCCENNTEQGNSNNNVNNNTNTTENNSGNNDGGNTTGTGEGGNTTGTGEGGNTTEKEEPIVGPEMTEKAWNKMFSIDTLNNVKVTCTSSSGPIKQPINGPMVLLNQDTAFTYTAKEGKSCCEITKSDFIVELLDSDYSEFFSTVIVYGDSNQALMNYLFNLSMSFGINYQRNSNDNGYVFSNCLAKPYKTYFEQTEKDDLLYAYEFEESSQKYIKSLIFAENSKMFDKGALEAIMSFKNLKDNFSKATYNTNKKCYDIPYSLFVGDTAPSSIENYVFSLYFENGLLNKGIIDLRDKEQNSYLEYVFSDYEKNDVTIPTNLTTCNHSDVSYIDNDEYHFAKCNKCYNVMEYAKHDYVDGKCKVCDYYPSVTEKITGSDGITHAELIKNSLTGKYEDLISSDTYYSSDGSTGDYEHVCFDETCNISFKGTIKSVEKSQDNPCIEIAISEISFFEDGIEVHDKIELKEIRESHSYEVLELGELCDSPYENYNLQHNIIHRGSVKCKNCGEVIEDVDIFATRSDESLDYLCFYKTGYRTFSGYANVPHQIDPMNSVCVYCGKNSSEIIQLYPMPKMDIDFYEVTLDEFKKDYDSEWTYLDFAGQIDATFCVGNVDYGRIYTDSLTYVGDTWTTTIDNDYVAICVGFTNSMAKNIIKSSVTYAAGGTGYKVSYYNSEECIGLLVSDDGYSCTKFYFDDSGLLIRYEYATHNGYTAYVATFAITD